MRSVYGIAPQAPTSPTSPTAPAAVRTMPAGYRLEVDADHLDRLRFDRLVATAAQVAESGDGHRAAAALGLWREPLLGNVESPTLQRDAVPRLTNLYPSAREDWAELCLRLDRADAVVDALSPVVRAHPFRERAVGHLMLALYRSGRRADALSLSDTLRISLRDEFGVDPGTACQDLFLKVLRADPALSHPGPAETITVAPDVATPRRLPPGIADAARKVTEADGEVRSAPKDSPYGRFAVVTDPFGAELAVMRTATP